MQIDMLELARNLVSFFIILLFSLCFHEYAHGQVAKWMGDNTAEKMGRLTLNPFPHMDMTGTVILPLMTVVLNSMGYGLPFFGWAKPVPVNSNNLKNPRTGMFWIALAGPMSNIILAFVGTAVLVIATKTMLTTPYYVATRTLLQQFVLTNLFLAIFNALPIHPLDGGKILARFLPASWNQQLEQFEQVSGMILIALLVMGALKYLAIPVYGAFKLLMEGASFFL